MLHMLGQRELARSLFPVGGLREDRDARPRRAVRAAGGVEAGLAGALLRARGRRRRRSCARAPRRWCARGRGRRRRRARPGRARRRPFAFTVGQRRGLGVATRRAGLRAGAGRRREPRRRGARASSWPRAGSSPTASRGWPAAAGRRPVRGRGPDPLPGRGCPGGGRRRSDGARASTFRTPQRAVAPGQSVVVYRGDELLGGGRIREATAEAAVASPPGSSVDADYLARGGGGSSVTPVSGSRSRSRSRTSSCTSRRRTTREESRAAALSFWEQLHVLRLRKPTSARQKRPLDKVAGRARDRQGGRLGGERGGRRADVLVPGRRGRCRRPVPARQVHEVTVEVRGRLLHPGEASGRSSRSRRRGGRSLAVAIGGRATASGSPRRSVAAAGAGPGRPRGDRQTCMLADAAAAGVQAILPKPEGSAWRSLPPAGARAFAAA